MLLEVERLDEECDNLEHVKLGWISIFEMALKQPMLFLNTKTLVSRFSTEERASMRRPTVISSVNFRKKIILIFASNTDALVKIRNKKCSSVR